MFSSIPNSPFSPNRQTKRRKGPGNFIHSDVCGSITLYRWPKRIIPLHSRCDLINFLFPVETKSSMVVKQRFLDLKTIFEQDRRKVRTLRRDGGGDYEKKSAISQRRTDTSQGDSARHTRAKWCRRELFAMNSVNLVFPQGKQNLPTKQFIESNQTLSIYWPLM